jgi:4-aminobutyrate aminotransferase-like enzyme
VDRGAGTIVQASGGLYVADEVQAGHGRTARPVGFWAGQVPADLVTLGKPMGNGTRWLPSAAQPTAIDPIADTDYFSTFGGAPHRARQRSPCFDAREEHVVPGSRPGRLTSTALRCRTREPAGGEVRGWGLAIAVGIVDPVTGRPDPNTRWTR